MLLRSITWEASPGTCKNGSDISTASPTSRTREGRGGETGISHSECEDRQFSNSPRVRSITSQQEHPDTGRSERASERLRQDRQMSDIIESGPRFVDSLAEDSIPLKLLLFLISKRMKSSYF